MNKTRPAFTHSAILSNIRDSFHQSTEALATKAKEISIVDCLLSGLAIFSLKYQSLLKFEEDKDAEPYIKHNLKSMYKIKKVPCDTYLRERLDTPDLSAIRTAISDELFVLQRGKVLDNWKFLDDKFLISLDATGFFSSNTVKCSCCCEKVLHKGTAKETTIYHHQMLVGSIVSPNMKQVLPIEFEPIIKEDGAKKNDCERNGAKRWLSLFRKSHPNLPTIIVADGLYSNAPFINNLKEERCSYIIVAKEDDHRYLYDYFWAGAGDNIGEFEVAEKDKYLKYRFMNKVPLNESNQDLEVNVLYFEEYNKKSKRTSKWLWVTDIAITKENAKSIMRSGRSRWRIENETFNTLKNQGYNFGHGYNGLSNVFAGLMLLAFFVDQILETMNLEYRILMTKFSRYNLFEKVRSKFCDFMISSFEKMYEVMINGPREERWL